MKRSHVIAAICVLLFGGCAHIRGIPPLEERSRPQVTVDKDGKIVSPAVLYFLPGERNVEIVWQLPRDSRYRFPTTSNVKEQGIVIEGRLAERVLRGASGADSVPLERQDEIVDCKPRNAGLEFVCLNKHSVPGVYKYTIRVLDGERRLTPLDPWVVNN